MENYSFIFSKSLIRLYKTRQNIISLGPSVISHTNWFENVYSQCKWGKKSKRNYSARIDSFFNFVFPRFSFNFCHIFLLPLTISRCFSLHLKCIPTVPLSYAFFTILHFPFLFFPSLFIHFLTHPVDFFLRFFFVCVLNLLNFSTGLNFKLLFLFIYFFVEIFYSLTYFYFIIFGSQWNCIVRIRKIKSFLILRIILIWW